MEMVLCNGFEELDNQEMLVVDGGSVGDWVVGLGCTALGWAVGTAVGAYIAGPVGAKFGAEIGQKVGNLVGGLIIGSATTAGALVVVDGLVKSDN